MRGLLWQHRERLLWKGAQTQILAALLGVVECWAPGRLVVCISEEILGQTLYTSLQPCPPAYQSSWGSVIFMRGWFSTEFLVEEYRLSAFQVFTPENRAPNSPRLGSQKISCNHIALGIQSPFFPPCILSNLLENCVLQEHCSGTSQNCFFWIVLAVRASALQETAWLDLCREVTLSIASPMIPLWQLMAEVHPSSSYWQVD